MSPLPAPLEPPSPPSRSNRPPPGAAERTRSHQRFRRRRRQTPRRLATSRSDYSAYCSVHGIRFFRGKLSLGLLSSWSMHLTFSYDDGHSEQLALLNNDFQVSEVGIEELSADNSGCSFVIKISESKVFYYWCVEKSKERGMELLAKMNNLLQGRPTLSDLTGISNSRLDAFVTNLHSYLDAPSVGGVKSLGSTNDFLTPSQHSQYLRHPSVVSKPSRFRTSAANATKASLIYQASMRVPDPVLLKM